MKLFDTHAHYNDEKYDNDREEIIKKTFETEVDKIVCAGYNLESSKKAIKLAEKYENIYAICGVSPNDIDEYDNTCCLTELVDLADHPKVVAIGEIGLDYYWEKKPKSRELQKEFFIKQIDIANYLNLPIVIHTRDAYIDTIKILKEVNCDNKGIIHCCPLNNELIKDALKLDFYISFSGVITFKNAHPDEIIKNIPLDRLLIETDSPYLTPEPYRGERNDSRKVIEVARKIAKIKNESLETIARVTYENSLRIYKMENSLE